MLLSLTLTKKFFVVADVDVEVATVVEVATLLLLGLNSLCLQLILFGGHYQVLHGYWPMLLVIFNV